MDKQAVSATLRSAWQSGISRVTNCLRAFGKWSFFGLLCGVIAGAAGTALLYVINQFQAFRIAHFEIIYLLPIAGLIITLLYRGARITKDRGTNLIICAARGEQDVPLRMAPLIFIGTALTHLCGGSTGREAAALQLGGSFGSWLGRRFHLSRQDTRVLVMCGMAASFSAIFGTPITAAVFSLEVAAVGLMPYVAFLPCAIAALIGHGIMLLSGVEGEAFTVWQIPDFSWLPLLQTAVLGVACAAVSLLFCLSMTGTDKLLERIPFMRNPYIRVAVGGVVIVLLTLLVGNTDYNGAGMAVIERAVAGEANWYAFLLKILFTVITLRCGFKGGEIVPALFIGATFGCTFASLIGLSPSLGAALGMAALFAGVTNCPTAAMLLGFELFGLNTGLYALLAVSICWSLSGRAGLYSQQTFALSKYHADALPTPGGSSNDRT